MIASTLAHSQPPNLIAYLAWLDHLIATTVRESATETELRRGCHQLQEVRAYLAGTSPGEVG